MKGQEEETPLVDFNWDNEEDFFEVKTEPATSTIKEAGSDKTTLESTEEEVEEDFFEADEPESKVFAGDSQWSNLYKELKTKGVISVDVAEGEEINEERFIEIQEEEIEARLDETIQAFMDELDDDAKAFLKFKREGGDTRQFFKVYSETSQAPELDITNEKSQRKFLEYYYRTHEQMDEDEVEDKIQWLEETGRMSKYAEKFNATLEEEADEYKEKLLNNQKQLTQQQEENRKKLVKDLKQVIDTSTAIKEWSITPKDKKDLHGYMTKAAVKIGQNQFLTQFQSDLQAVFKDKEKMILLAKLVSSDFDVQDIKNKAKTEVAKETKSKLSNAKVTGNSTKGSHNKGLADYF